MFCYISFIYSSRVLSVRPNIVGVLLQIEIYQVGSFHGSLLQFAPWQVMHQDNQQLQKICTQDLRLALITVCSQFNLETVMVIRADTLDTCWLCYGFSMKHLCTVSISKIMSVHKTRSAGKITRLAFHSATAL